MSTSRNILHCGLAASLGLLLVGLPAGAATLYPQPVIGGFSPSAGPAGTIVTVTGRGFGGANAAWFGTAHDATVKVMSGSEIQVTVPANAPVGADRLAVVNPKRLALAARAFTVTAPAAGKPALTLNPPMLSFGDQAVGTTSTAQSVTLGNAGTAALNLSSITASTGYGESSTCPSTLAAGGQCSLSVTFSPTGTGMASGVVSIVSNAAGSPATITLSGTGVASKPVVTVALNPGTVTLGGSSTLTWSSTNATACTASGAWSGAQAPGGSLSVSPGAAGSYSYALSCTGAGGTGTGSASLTVNAAAGFALAVQGNKLVDGSGHTVQLRGANISGLESTAIQGWDPSDPWGDSGFAGGPQWSTLKAWDINVVRLPLNEASWLALTTYNHDGSSIQADPGQNYQATVIKAVQDATAAGLYVILDLHWSGPNVPVPGQPAPVPQTPFEANGGQNPMADADHSVAFWTSVAMTFKGNPAVAFELYNEPYFYWITDSEAEWGVLLNGGTITQYVTGANPYTVGYDWQAVGMQQLLNAVRATGATNVVITGGVDWCGDLQDWLANMPADPLHQLAASWHAYPLSDTVGDPNATVPTDGVAEYGYVKTIAATVPVVITETGDHSANGTVGSPFDSIVLPWADSNGVSYLGWTWDPWGASDFDLIKDTSGTPTDGFGQYFHDHLLCRGNGGVSCP
jgi:endoglucanase